MYVAIGEVIDNIGRQEIFFVQSKEDFKRSSG